MSLQLTIVGCSGSYPGPDSPASCYLVQAEHEGRTWNILMDLGNGALGALHRYVDPLDIDAVFLSHLHADHCIDMTSYYVLRKYHPSGEQEPLPVWGPRRTARRLARAYDLPASRSRCRCGGHGARRGASRGPTTCPRSRACARSSCSAGCAPRRTRSRSGRSR